MTILDQKPTLEYARPKKRSGRRREQLRFLITVLYLTLPFVVVGALWFLVWLIGP